MVVAIAPWSVVLEPGKPEVIVPQSDLQIKNAALPDVLADESGRTTVKLTYQSLASVESDDEDDEKSESGAAMTTVLCSLTAGKIEQASCEIILEQDGEYLLELVGKNSVHLYGNYIDQAPVDQPPFGSDESDEEEEDAYNLGEVSSDVEIEVDTDEQDLEGDVERFEEVEEKAPEKASPKNLKRTHDDAMETEEPEKLSKSQKKKLAKKLKAEDGKAVPAPTEAKKPEPETKVDKPAAEAKEGKKEKKEKKDKVEKKADDGEKKEKGAEKKEARTLEGGVKVRDVKVGTGKMAKKGDKVKMRYIGKLTNGKVFDKNTSGKPFGFTLGAGEVIKGWDVGIAGMQVQGEREVVCPPSMAYGNKKIPDIPPNSTLIFEVKMLEIK
ncbi:hypothetical protein F5I97DRAFT_1852461 [Phlebopus sp. FC_14]|nr:hypothetical protein F5I97DRAFT_1852461 [Phlebopus sp. FC_14]